MDMTVEPGTDSALPLRLLLICYTAEEEIFVGEKFRTFSSWTFRMEFNFVLAEWPKRVNAGRDDRKACKPVGRKFGMDINFLLLSIVRMLRN